MVKFIFEGQEYDLKADEILPDLRERVAAEAVFLLPDNTPLTGAVLQRVRDRVSGIYAHMPSPRERSSPTGERSWLLPGLWPWGTIPMLGGAPKVGKTAIVVDLTASLLVPDRKFLGRFDIAEARIPNEEFRRGVWLINAETPVEDLEAALPASDDQKYDSSLVIDHLEALGGAQVFDLTNPELYDLWAHRLIECWECDGDDDRAPFVVIVDGLTAILQAAGKGVEHYGLWYAAFRRLLRSIDIPNGLVVGHNTLAGGHLMGGVEAQAGADGLWNLDGNAKGRRTFSVLPRLGGVRIEPTPVEMNADGSLVLRPRRIVQAAETTEKTTVDALLDYVIRSASSGHGPSAREIRHNVPGDNAEIEAERDRLVDEGRLVKLPRVGRGGGDAYWPARQDEPAAGGNDSK